MPKTCFGRESSEYIDSQLVTTFMMDGDGWVIVNDIDDLVAQYERVNIMSVGTAGFISSMERDEDDSEGGTVVEVPTPEDMAEVQK